MVEAGTGTGKSFAYLVPAALFAVQNRPAGGDFDQYDQPAGTADQEGHSGPASRPRIGSAGAVLKRSLQLSLPAPARTSCASAAPRVSKRCASWPRFLVWLSQGGSGDRTEINLNGPIEREKWMRISAEDEGCRARSVSWAHRRYLPVLPHPPGSPKCPPANRQPRPAAGGCGDRQPGTARITTT